MHGRRTTARSPPHRFQWSERIEETIQRSKTLSWLNGPYPRIFSSIRPRFPALQAQLRGAVLKHLPAEVAGLVIVPIVILWLLIFSIALTRSHRGIRHLSERGQALQLACNTRLWQDPPSSGLNGRNCLPFDGQSFTYRCPSNCASVRVLEPYTVGDRSILYETVVIGGGDSTSDLQSQIYRGDSFICQASIHAGIFNDRTGGCGKLNRVGEFNNFVASHRNGISSIGSTPVFPLAFTLDAVDADCSDPQWVLFAFSLSASILVALLTTSSAPFVVATFIIVFFQVALASDRAFFPDQASAISTAFERFLPAACVVLVVYHLCIRKTLSGLQAPLEKIVLWLGGCWIGALNNYTFDRIPISRLTVHDLKQQPGAITALLVILTLIFCIGLKQAIYLRREGRLLWYMSAYLFIALILVSLALIPDLQLRLHHYIIALILLPGTSLQTRSSLLYQGLLFGLLINGTARWGFASILQTAEALRQDGLMGSAVPQLEQVNGFNATNIQFMIQRLAGTFDGIGVVVNDVERYQISRPSLPVRFNWTRSPNSGPTYFRFAFTSMMPFGGLSYGDYTPPITWHPDGSLGPLVA